MSHRIAVLPGDGIGPEIIEQAVRVLTALDLPLTLEQAPVGGAAYDLHGHPLPEATLALAQSSAAVLFGAVGDWKYDKLPREHRPEQSILGLRKAMGLFANYRPAILYPELANASSLKPEVVSGLDLLILRELTGDIYFGEPRGIRKAPSGPLRASVKGLTPCVTPNLKFVGLRTWAFKRHKSARAGCAALIRPMCSKRRNCGVMS